MAHAALMERYGRGRSRSRLGETLQEGSDELSPKSHRKEFDAVRQILGALAHLAHRFGPTFEGDSGVSGGNGNGNGNGSSEAAGNPGEAAASQQPVLPPALQKMVKKAVTTAIQAEKAADLIEDGGTSSEWYRPLIAGPQRYRDPTIFGADWRERLPVGDSARPTKPEEVITPADAQYRKTLRIMEELDNPTSGS